MAKLVYDETGRLLFTKEMKEEYTILMPQMLPIHFGMFRKLLELEGYHVDQLNNDGRSVVDEGLKYVHNDTCYPALLVIGQFMDAIKHGGYDPGWRRAAPPSVRPGRPWPRRGWTISP